ncbi:MAG: hypothetical protein K9L77_01870 [Candidatus Omnitrophica bacterium]|nr:hypothetical protein [Candidatus Omnitrophota bacterium]
MYVYLEENRNAYHKGQLTPFFIAVLTILIIGIMVTVNIGKVAKIKTHTSNSADAGALAAASAMASTFNALGAYASYMYILYLDLKDIIERLIDEAEDATARMIAWLASAAAIASLGASLACPLLMAGQGMYIASMAMGIAFLLMAEYELAVQFGIMENVKGYIEALHEQQQMLYYNDDDESNSIREMVDDGVDSARESALALGFANSGVFSMLAKEQQEDYEDFIEDLSGSSATYSWQDGQNRQHDVTMEISLDDVVKYQLYETNEELDTITEDYYLLYYVLYGAIGAAIAYLVKQYNSLRSQASSYSACPQWICYTYPAGCVVPCYCSVTASATWPVIGYTAATAAAAAAFFPIFSQIEEAIQENGTFWNSSGDVGDKIITTIADVEHSRELSVSSQQQHEGADLTLWQTSYDVSPSGASASFSGGALDGHGITGVGHVPRLIEAN